MNFRKWLPNRGIRTQLVILLFALTAISVVAVSTLGVTSVLSSGAKAQHITSNAMQQRAEELLGQTAAATADKNSLIFQHVLEVSNNSKTFVANLFDNSGTFVKSGWKFDSHVSKNAAGQYVNPAADTSSVYIPGMLTLTPQLKQEFELTAYLDNLFPSVLTNEQNAVATYFTGTQGETRYYPNIGLGEIIPVDYTPVTDVFFVPATPENDPDKKAIFSPLYDDPAGNGLMITAINPVYTAAGQFKGVVDMDVLLNKVAANIESYKPIESSYAFLVDEGGRAVALPDQAFQDILKRAPKKGEFGVDLSKVKGDYGETLKQMRAGKSGFKEVKLASGSVLDVAYSPVVGTSFSLGIAAKQSVLLKVVADLQKQVNSSTQQMVWGRVLPIGIVLLAVVWFYGFFYIRRFSDPINKLTAKTAQLATGNFDIDPVVISAKNEIGQLAKAFNAMVADLKTSHTKIEDQNEALTREQVRLKASINSMPFGFAIVGLEGDVVFHNAVLAHLVGRDIPDEPAASRRVLKEVSHEYKAAIDLLGSIKATLDTHRAHEKEVEIGTHFFRFFFAPIIDVVDGSEQAIGTLMVMEDVTEARALERSREEFFSIASHELRTPLTAIRGNTDMVLNYYQEQLKDPALHEMITDIHDGSVRLISIVNDFLDVSRLEQQRLEFKNAPFDIVALVNETLHEYNVTGSRKNLSLELEPPTGDVPQVLADRDRTRQILINLVGNAIKFTEKGGVKVQLKPKDNTMEITVTDTGRGIPDKYIHLLFRKFQQATQSILTRDDTKGTGLGLYISRLLAVGMNGNLALKSTKEGEGTAFTLTLPLAPAGQAADAGKDKPTPPTPAAS